MEPTDDPIQRSTALGPPSLAEVELMHLISVLVEEKPKRLKRLLTKARDHAAATKVKVLHGADGDAAWDAAFVGAELRYESVAVMIRANAALKPAKSKKKRRLR